MKTRFIAALRTLLASLAIGTLLVVAVPHAAHADTVTWGGELRDGSNQWQRPNCATITGSTEYWDAVDFTVSVAGSYQITMTGAAIDNIGIPDTFLLLYTAPFDPASPLSNCLAYNDDVNGMNSALTVPLASGVRYTLVSTQCCDGTARDQWITFTNSITGPGTAQILPAAVTFDIPAFDATSATADATLTLSMIPAADVTVTLTSSQPALLGAPASVTIPAGTTQVTIPLRITGTTGPRPETVVTVTAGRIVSDDARYRPLLDQTATVTFPARAVPPTVPADPTTELAATGISGADIAGSVALATLTLGAALFAVARRRRSDAGSRAN